ncbi:DUF429 domain-containing protein [Nocardioides lianchengensis]|uniref:Predicted nuclease (RNAse H fold) n=1 Tax=Nocardioides lianchengensis TaxID=1045774 RepID=A0A1G6LCV8_9ACTN|nr:DUF429 domain-containing protein [Nocardioides lianchengensis]NYG12600.1 putative RNase H-like nuclease [Nocardioides lianchengensis]SDC41034.1 Predicted nuclease (RNAse H fold) [Nocardioides lianchengensis]
MQQPVHYIGLDLAWGPKGPTGVAVIDPEARLLHVSTRRSDEEIDAALAPYVGEACLVAIDAPVIVRNPTGSRPAEKALSKDFRRFEAGTHPSNTGKPEFADGGRAWHLAKRHGLDVNPRSGRARRAIEVYPHPATIVLFGLGRTLKYKHKTGRDLELLRSELLELMRHVESVVTVDETWQALRRQVEQAARKSELRVVEDQVDAVVCAYVGLFADRWPDRTTTYGDLETGYIVTPALPDESAVIGRAVQEYAASHAGLVAAGERALGLVTSILDEAGINYLSVTGRTKSVSSFAEKAGRMADGKPLYSDPLREITDQIGLRVITYAQSDVDAVARLLADQVVVVDDRDMGRETASEGRFGYASRHLLVEVGVGRVVQVQVRTVLQHAWAEFEHDIRYKGQMPAEHARDFDRRFTLAAGLLELADREFSAIRDKLREAATPTVAVPDDDPRLDPRELAAFLAGQYADAGWSRTDHYAWISGLLLELGITSLDELADTLRPTATMELSERMDYRYPPGAVRRLDDALLAVFEERYVELHGNAHRAPLLRQRLEKLRG